MWKVNQGCDLAESTEKRSEPGNEPCGIHVEEGLHEADVDALDLTWFDRPAVHWLAVALVSRLVRMDRKVLWMKAC